MTGSRISLATVLVPVDFDDASHRALRFAASIARQIGASLILLQAIHLNIVGEEQGVPRTKFVDELRSDAERDLRQLVQTLGIASARVLVRAGDPVATVIVVAKETSAGIVVLGGPQRRGLSRWLRSSLERKLFHNRVKHLMVPG